MSVSRRAHCVLGLLTSALVMTAAACSSGAAESDESNGALPPNNKAAIEKVFTRELDQLGLRLTRGGLLDIKTRRPSSNGRHLAVYVEPTGPYTDDDYARRIVAVTKVFAPRSFDRWEGLKSFDVCQEPLPSVDTRPEPPPKTQVTMTRKAARRVHWNGLDLPQLLIDAERLGERQLSVYAEPDVRTTATYQDALVKAQAEPPPTSAPSSPSYER